MYVPVGVGGTCMQLFVTVGMGIVFSCTLKRGPVFFMCTSYCTLHNATCTYMYMYVFVHVGVELTSADELSNNDCLIVALKL